VLDRCAGGLARGTSRGPLTTDCMCGLPEAFQQWKLSVEEMPLQRPAKGIWRKEEQVRARTLIEVYHYDNYDYVQLFDK
jgi:hypothetical protein